jgi:hypothetical protein
VPLPRPADGADDPHHIEVRLDKPGEFHSR